MLVLGEDLLFYCQCNLEVSRQYCKTQPHHRRLHWSKGLSVGGDGSLGGRSRANGDSSSPLAPHTFSAITESTWRGGSHPCFEWLLCLISIGLLISHFTLQTNPGEGYNLQMSKMACMINLTSPHFCGRDTCFFLTYLVISRTKQKEKLHLIISSGFL